MDDVKSVLVGLSGGVDSTVAALRLQQDGYHVIGLTMLLWGGTRQGSSCSTGDASAAQAAANHLGIELRTINWTDAFTRHVTEPHANSALDGQTDNPCINCNRTFKLDGLIHLADTWGIPHVATGHYARTNGHQILRGADPAKDQSYVLATATRTHLSRYIFPLGELTKSDVRHIARQHSLPAAEAPDSMGLCLDRGDLLTPTPLQLRDTNGNIVGLNPRGELLTVGQRRGVHTGGGGPKQYVLDVNPRGKTATIGPLETLQTETQSTTAWTWTGDQTPTGFQSSAHGTPQPGKVTNALITWDTPQRTVAPGQLIVAYHHDTVVGHSTATRNR